MLVFRRPPSLFEPLSESLQASSAPCASEVGACVEGQPAAAATASPDMEVDAPSLDLRGEAPEDVILDLAIVQTHPPVNPSSLAAQMVPDRFP